MATKDIVRKIFPYIICVLIVFFIQCMMFDILNSDMNTPTIYAGDGVAQQAIIKSIQENGVKGIYVNPRLGAPYIADYRDYPNADVVTVLIMRIICFFTPNSSYALNIFILASYYICAVVALFVMRKLGFNNYLSMLVALIYAFVPYHYLRHQHTALMLYGFMPLALPICQYMVTEPSKLFYYDGRMHFTNDSLYCIVACFLIAMTGVLYYSIFCGFLFLVSSAYAYANEKKGCRKAIVYNFLIVAGTIFMAQLINYIPYFMYWVKVGTNDGPLIRYQGDAETFGLKLIQLLLPIENHKISAFSNLTNHYNNNYPLINENTTSTLGFIGSIGFIYLIIRLFKINKNTKDKKAALLDNLAVLNIACVLLGTIGGLGSIISLTIFSALRGYNRISILIAFICLLATAYLLENLSDKLNKKSLFAGLLAVAFIGSLGLLDIIQYKEFTSAEDIQSNSIETEQMQEIESHIEEQSMVLQYPFMAWPGEPYSYLKPYIYGEKDIHWSAGGVVGRGTDKLLSPINNMTAPEILSYARGLKFSYLLFDTTTLNAEDSEYVRNAFTQAMGEPLSITGQYTLYAID